MEGALITVSVFSCQNSNSCLDSNLIQDIKYLARKTEAVSKSLRIAPPQLNVWALLIPDWSDPRNSYTDQNYQSEKEEFLSLMQRALQGFAAVCDFEKKSRTNAAYRNFMHGLGRKGVGGLGSCADLIKFDCVISSEGVPHLNLDSNTKITDCKRLFQMTFLNPTQRDLLNATLYENDFVTAHNKIMYTPPNSQLRKALKKSLLEYLRANQFNQEVKVKNHLYSRVFLPTTQQLGMTYSVIRSAEQKTYLASLTHSCFELSKIVLTSVNRSWAANQSDQTLPRAMPKFCLGQVLIDYGTISYIVRKYTIPIYTGGHVSQENYYQQFFEISPSAFQLQALREYFTVINDNYPELRVFFTNLFHQNRGGDIFFQQFLGESHEKLQKQWGQRSDKRNRTGMF